MKQYGSRGVVFIGASLDDAKTQPRIPAFVAEHKIGFPVWYGATADDLDRLKLGARCAGYRFPGLRGPHRSPHPRTGSPGGSEDSAWTGLTGEKSACPRRSWW